jgi:hypothetical protein
MAVPKPTGRAIILVKVLRKDRSFVGFYMQEIEIRRGKLDTRALSPIAVDKRHEHRHYFVGGEA